MLKSVIVKNTLQEVMALRNNRAFMQDIFLSDFLKLIPKAYKKKWPIDKLNWWSRSTEYDFVIRGAESLDTSDKLELLEFGPGISFITSHFSKCFGSELYSIVDVDQDVNDFWLDTHGIQSTKLENVADASKDFVFSVSVLEHTNDPVSMVKDIVSKLKPGGKLILTMDIDLSAEVKSQLGLSVKDLNEIMVFLGCENEKYSSNDFENRFKPPFFWSLSFMKIGLLQLLRLIKSNIVNNNRNNIAVILIEYTKCEV